jgi:Zn-dependent protease
MTTRFRTGAAKTQTFSFPLYIMRPGPNDISFDLFGFPTTVQPFFWLIAAVITALSLGPFDNMPIWLSQMLLGMLGVFLSILVHELGHAFAFRHVFRTPCVIVLHSFGGMAVPLQHYSRSYGIRGMMANSFLSFAGPGAGFLLAFLMFAFLKMMPAANNDVLGLLRFFFYWTMVISIFWGLLNLLPIYPMDGGHISREFFSFFFPRRGIEFSLMLSMLCAILFGVIALRLGMLIITFLFAYFAYQNYQEMTFTSSRRWK